MKYLIASFLLLILGLTGFLDGVRNRFSSVFVPIQYGLSVTAYKLKSGFWFFKGLRQIREENLRLKKENFELESAISQLRSLGLENNILKNQLNVLNKDTFDNEYILADVMKNFEDNTGSTIIIDKGSRHGVLAGDNVIFGNFLVGIVEKVYFQKSLVTLVTSPNLTVSVYDIDSVDKVEGISKGKYGTSIVMQRILSTEQIKVGDMIVSSGKDGRIIPGLLVGKIVDIKFDTTSLVKEAQIQTNSDVLKLSKVFIIKSL